MKQIWMLGAAVLLIAGGQSLATEETSDTQTLLKSYYWYGILTEIEAGARTLAADRSAAVTQQVNAVVGRWAGEKKQAVRTDLQTRFGQQAKSCFAFFVGRYTEAESKGDPQYLAAMNADLRLDPPPKTYADLRRRATDRWFKGEIKSAGNMMGDIQTWANLAAAGKKVPTLRQWLERDQPAAAAQPANRLNALAAAEGPTAEFKPEKGKQPDTALDTFDGLRSERRTRVVAEAQAGMKQVADERRAAEEEQSQRQAAEAQREADAVKAYSQKLAEAEKEAVEQGQNTWGARLKRLAVSVVSGSAGAVTSGLGAAAGAAVAKEVFE